MESLAGAHVIREEMSLQVEVTYIINTAIFNIHVHSYVIKLSFLSQTVKRLKCLLRDFTTFQSCYQSSY